MSWQSGPETILEGGVINASFGIYLWFNLIYRQLASLVTVGFPYRVNHLLALFLTL